MKALLEFDLEDFDDVRAHKRCVHSLDMAIFIWELKHNLIRKAHRQEMSLEDFTDLLDGSINDLGFDIDDLIV